MEKTLNTNLLNIHTHKSLSIWMTKCSKMVIHVDDFKVIDTPFRRRVSNRQWVSSSLRWRCRTDSEKAERHLTDMVLISTRKRQDIRRWGKMRQRDIRYRIAQGPIHILYKRLWLTHMKRKTKLRLNRTIAGLIQKYGFESGV